MRGRWLGKARRSEFWDMRLMGENVKHLGLSRHFSKEVPKMFGIGRNGQLTKVQGDDFRVRLCWEF